MPRDYIVYMHVNKINQKKYIGITCQGTEKRWQNGKGYKKQPYFMKAINKYGWDNFDHVILESGLTKEEAGVAEHKYIELYDSANDEKGYNLGLGGEGAGRHSQETRKKMSDTHKKMLATPEAREKLSQAQKKRYSDETVLQKQRALMRAIAKDPEIQEKINKKKRLRYQDPEQRRKTSEASKRYCANPEVREQMRQRSIERYKSPEAHLKTSEGNRRRWSDPEERKRQSERMRAFWNTPEGKEKKREASKKLWSNPETRKKLCESAKRGWEKRREKKPS